MVQALINISDHSNRLLNIVKAKYGLKNKSEAIDRVMVEYEDLALEPELRPEFVESMLKLQEEELIEVGTVEDLRKRYE